MDKQLTEEGLRLVKAFRQISSPEARMKVIELAEKLATQEPKQH